MNARCFAFLILVALAPRGVAAQSGQPVEASHAGDNSPTAQYERQSVSLVGNPAVAVLETTVQSQSAGAMVLADVEQTALNSNPCLAQAAARVEALRGRCLQVGLYPNPTAGYIGSEIGNDGRAGQQGGFVGQEIVTAGKLQLNREIVGQEINQANWAYQAQRLRVLTDVRRAFYEVLIAQQSMELTGQLVQIGERGVKSTEELLKAKEVARNDVLQAKIEADTARVLYERARNRHATAWRNLAAVMGTGDMPPKPLAGNIQDGIGQFTWGESLQRLWSQSPQLAGARAGVDRAQAALRRECAGRIPNLDLQTSVQYDNASGDTFASVQVGSPIPVFNRNQGNIRRAEAELIAAQHEVRRTEFELQQRLAAVFEQYTNAQYQAEKYSKDILPNAHESLKLTATGYQQGQLNYLSVLTAQRTFFQTNLTYLEALRELRAAAAIIEGHLLSDSLRAEDTGDGAGRPSSDLDARGP